MQLQFHNIPNKRDLKIITLKIKQQRVHITRFGQVIFFKNVTSLIG